MKDTDNTGLACLGALVGFPLIEIAVRLLEGWVLQRLWSWFITPYWKVSELSFGAAVGACIVIGYLTSKVSYAKEDEEKYTLTNKLVLAVVRPLIYFACGWLVWKVLNV